ncbi:MAG: FAD-binding oxidoreductase [Acidimicrobiia bacterium]
MTDGASVFDELCDIASTDDNGAQMLEPRSLDEAVQAVQSLASATTTALIVGSGSTFSSLPAPEAELRLTSAGFVGITDYQPDDLTVVVNAGTTLGELSETLETEGQTAVLPETDQHRTVGGVVSEGASGYRRLRYGPTRDRVLGVTLVTGYGKRIAGGGHLVKNVTGYDLPRLCTGSHGTLGFIADVCLKLWPVPPVALTIDVDDADEARSRAYKPLAVLETTDSVRVMVEGSEASVSEAERMLGGSSRPGLIWPDSPSGPITVSLRVPASSTTAAVSAVRGAGTDQFVAQHGVGRVDASFADLSPESLAELRTRIGELGGVVVITGWNSEDPLPDRWGFVPDGFDISARLTSLFDPAGVFRIGQLPGGL